MVNAYLLKDKSPVSLKELSELGVDYWKLDPTDYEEKLGQIEKERNFGFRSEITCSRECIGETYDALMDKFFTEHLHTYPEIRFIMDGSGIFDIRTRDQKDWIRIEVSSGDLITLAAGMYHRFKLDDKEYLKAMRLFVKDIDEPVWTPENKGEKTDQLDCRKSYLEEIGTTVV